MKINRETALYKVFRFWIRLRKCFILFMCVVFLSAMFGCANRKMLFNTPKGNDQFAVDSTVCEKIAAERGPKEFFAFGPLIVFIPLIIIFEIINASKRHKARKALQDCMMEKGYVCVGNCSYEQNQVPKFEKKEEVNEPLMIPMTEPLPFVSPTDNTKGKCTIKQILEMRKMNFSDKQIEAACS